MAEPLRDIFIRNLKFYRKRQGLSQEKLSYAIDMSMNYVNQLENKNSFPPPEIIDKMAAVLNVKPAQFFDENESPENIIAANKEEFVRELTEQIHSRMKNDIRKIISETIGEKLR
ncbi:helix-turn-helix domain-containing protein [Treponema brennaborense]|uniref:Helix-turn-helix domain protein n=1 Tax=Treponema brennaborense (strain DSM 12168 / CIP 105900 / DD5/3) TaxID=906968 RepID=F4LLW0_TREBD|nr:helix-turn-helix transcriptional regulator [Treponema brennaborense]AEE15652.1 helix-turn-helix domain protein [Treponema brennaborense DSM 12168]